MRVSREELDKSSQDEAVDEEDDDDDDDKDGDEDEEEFDDPDEVDVEGAEDVDSDDEIDSDDAFGSDDEGLIEKFTFRGSSKPKAPNGKVASNGESDEEEEEEEEEDDDDDSDSGSENGNIEDLGSNDDDDSEGSEESGDEDDQDIDESTAKAQAETKKILAQERKQVLTALSQSAKADADKGIAVRQQRRTFDALLNMRIRMQKALVAANSLHAVAEEDAADSADTSSALEDAAGKVVDLLRTVQSIRQALYAGGDAKRKRSSDGKDKSCQTIFHEMTQAEDTASAKRRKVLDRWAARVQRPGASSGAAAGPRRFAGSSASQQALTAILDGQLVTPERLVRRTRTPRSCAPVQASKRVEEDPEIYDDADFYQLLLKELVDQRTVDGSATGSAAPTVRWAAVAAREAKVRKQVDRKASKGRKMRFTVHEKLQNFAAPEDRRDWEPEAIDRFFSSLFGQRMALQEDDGADEDDGYGDDEPDGGVRLDGAGLRLF